MACQHRPRARPPGSTQALVRVLVVHPAVVSSAERGGTSRRIRASLLSPSRLLPGHCSTSRTASSVARRESPRWCGSVLGCLSRHYAVGGGGRSPTVASTIGSAFDRAFVGRVLLEEREVEPASSPTVVCNGVAGSLAAATIASATTCGEAPPSRLPSMNDENHAWSVA